MDKDFNNMNQTSEIMKDLVFPKTVNRKLWEKYLERELTIKEINLIENFAMERSFNRKMKKLYDVCKKKGLGVKGLTGLYGDCMFESLNYYNIGYDIKSLRLGLAYIMNIFKDHKNFFPTQETTLKELFNMFNEVQFVSCINKNKTKTFHFYTYETMLKDLSNEGSWTMLPTQLILMVISLIFQVEIIIINNETEYETIINVYQESTVNLNLQKVYIGQLGESHYLPLYILETNEELDIKYYTDEQKNFLKWAKNMERFKILEHEKNMEKKTINKSDNLYEFKELKHKKNNNVNFD